MPTPALNTDQPPMWQEIQHLLDQQAAAWNRGDIEGFMGGYWHSAEVSFSSGREVFRGWQSTLDRYRARYRMDGREMGQLQLGHLEIESLCPECAFVRGQWQVVTRRDTMNGQFTLILRRLPEGWRIIHDHTSA